MVEQSRPLFARLSDARVRDARRLAVLAVAIFTAVTGCASPAVESTPSGSAAQTSTETATVFTSPIYGYSATITTAWRVVPAQVAWDGQETVGHASETVDQLITPQVAGRCEHVFLCGPNAWAFAVPTTQPLDAVAADMDAAEVRDHDCPATPESEEPAEIDGEPAVISVTHCPANAPDGGLLILRAIALHDGTAFYFLMQDPAQLNQDDLDPLIRSSFEDLIAAVRLP
jgi:hypothetical protein